MESDFIQSQKLPRKNRDWLIRFIDTMPTLLLIGIGLLAYCLVVIFFSLLFCLLPHSGSWLTQNQKVVIDFWEILYFNFVTVLTVGYGDYVPVGAGRWLAICEALIGLGLFSIFVGVAILKITLPPSNSIVFSKYGYYLRKEQRFLVIFINTNRTLLVNAELSSLLRIGNDWKVRPASKTPYIGNSAWTFMIEELPLSTIKGLKISKSKDVLKFGITGTYGSAKYSTAIGYHFEDVRVIDSRENLVNDPALVDVQNFTTDKFKKAFNYLGDNPKPFLEFARENDAIITD